ncbi:MAG TPA: hypothetical protein VET88_09190, partial [Gammaproteobacteria bacterium]|nr:hypothetical protein [Gammaproteobacteria bacterium]
MVAGKNRYKHLIAICFTAVLFSGLAGLQAAPKTDPADKAARPRDPGKPDTAQLRRQEILRQVPRYAPDRVLVRFLPGTAASETGKAHRQAGGSKLREISGIGVHVVQV